METIEIKMDGKNYISTEKYRKIENELNELHSRATKDAYESIKEGRYGEILIETLSEKMSLDRKTEEKIKRTIELPDYRPITVARALINVKRMIGEYGIKENRYSTSELRQIAEHLLVYCNGVGDD